MAMKKQIRSGFLLLKELSLFFKDVSTYFYKGWKAGLGSRYAISMIRSFMHYLNLFRASLQTREIDHFHIEEAKIEKLGKTSKGLHSILPQDSRFSYSILIPIDHPRLDFLEKSLRSLLHQSPSQLEILIGLNHPYAKEVENLLKKIQECCNIDIQIYFFQDFDKEDIVNELAEKASKNFFFIMGEEDWLRPDLFFRYEQTLRIFSYPEKRVLYCNLNVINEKGFFIPDSEYQQPSQLCPPFIFKPFIEKGLLVPRALWKEAGGLQKIFKGAVHENLLLNLDLAGAVFQHVPLALYSVRSPIHENEGRSQQMFLESLQRYSVSKPLNWKWAPGYQINSVKAIPPLPDLCIQVIIPFKDQKDLTSKCIQSILKQKNVRFKITCVDNESADQTIAEEIQSMGGEVIAVKEPFNYSRINNIAVKSTKTGVDCPVLLFLNNDVELEETALSEMLRWIEQPKIGMVGCRLHYPDGRLQHGGVSNNFHGKREMRWEHVEKLRTFEQMKDSKTLGIFEAVTCACAMIKRETFLDVGGFDEIWYPNGYSDTQLALKISAKGLKCFYTPYAFGIHHESISRKSSIEDFEKSWWLHHLLIENGKMENSSQLSRTQ